MDEDKRPFVRRRICSTLLGGYRTVFNEAEEKGIPIHLHFLQLLIYLIVPGIVIATTLGLKSNRAAAVIISGVVTLGLNLVFQTISYLL